MSKLEGIATAITEALDECAVEDVLAVVTGAFVGLTTELIRRNGHDPAKPITLNGGKNRDITLHAEKGGAE